MRPKPDLPLLLVNDVADLVDVYFRWPSPGRHSPVPLRQEQSEPPAAAAAAAAESSAGADETQVNRRTGRQVELNKHTQSAGPRKLRDRREGVRYGTGVI